MLPRMPRSRFARSRLTPLRPSTQVRSRSSRCVDICRACPYSATRIWDRFTPYVTNHTREVR
jgi:hypothetical protein